MIIGVLGNSARMSSIVASRDVRMSPQVAREDQLDPTELEFSQTLRATEQADRQPLIGKREPIPTFRGFDVAADNVSRGYHAVRDDGERGLIRGA
jgi:hypothetical protein